MTKIKTGPLSETFMGPTGGTSHVEYGRSRMFKDLQKRSCKGGSVN